jgi:hypothetical protein
MRFIGEKTRRGNAFYVMACLLSCVSFLYAQEGPIKMDQLCRDYRKAGRTEEAFSLYQQGIRP